MRRRSPVQSLREAVQAVGHDIGFRTVGVGQALIDGHGGVY